MQTLGRDIAIKVLAMAALVVLPQCQDETVMRSRTDQARATANADASAKTDPDPSQGVGSLNPDQNETQVRTDFKRPITFLNSTNPPPAGTPAWKPTPAAGPGTTIPVATGGDDGSDDASTTASNSWSTPGNISGGSGSPGTTDGGPTGDDGTTATDSGSSEGSANGDGTTDADTTTSDDSTSDSTSDGDSNDGSDGGSGQTGSFGRLSGGESASSDDTATDDGTATTDDGAADDGTGATDDGTGTTDAGTGATDDGTGTADDGTATADGGTGTSDGGTGTADGDTGSASGGDGSTTQPSNVTNTVSGLGGFQVKSPELLKSAVRNCFGSLEMATLKDPNMFADTEPKLPTYSAASGQQFHFFLRQNSAFVQGANIIDLLRSDLAGETATRIGIRNDNITETYLQAMVIVADVIAHNCDLNDTKCQCSDRFAAEDLLTRCLPHISEADIAGVIPEFVKTCNGMGSRSALEGARRAIAAMISSYAFIKK